ncbi:MAG: GxxExxY protein, partial [Chloroflexi bacterium]|nr:GxxExxY protein [Chloroflexota bacterium]
MPSKRIQMPYDELTYQIIGCAMAVHRRLGPGYREDTYQRDLEVELAQKGLPFLSQKLVEVYDTAQNGVLIGYYIPDFIVAEQVVVEIKALPGLDNSHMAQVIAYLTVTGCQVGLLMNFGTRSLQFRRILPPTKISEHKVNRRWLWVPDSW